MIRELRGDFRFMSNFWPARVCLDNERYDTVEHAYQAAKTRSARARRQIRDTPTPAAAKRTGRALPLDEYTTPYWPVVRVAVMAECIRQKFMDNTLQRLLVQTEDEPIQEGNTWGDEFWGVNIHTGEGLNMLGSLLMIERANIIYRDCSGTIYL